MKGTEAQRLTSYLNDLDVAIDRMMTTYFNTVKKVQEEPDSITTEILDDVTIEVNNVMHVAGLTSDGLTDSTQELVRLVVTKTTRNLLEAIQFMFTEMTVEERDKETQFTILTDKAQMTAHPDLAFFIISIRNNDLLKGHNIHITVMDGSSKVQAA